MKDKIKKIEQLVRNDTAKEINISITKDNITMFIEYNISISDDLSSGVITYVNGDSVEDVINRMYLQLNN